MKTKYTILLCAFFLFSANAKKDNIIYFKNETLDSCYKKPMSPAVQNCMIYLSTQNKNRYEDEYKEFIQKVTSSKNNLDNYNEFISLIKKAKESWDIYISNECLAEGFINEKNSVAFFTDYNSCLATAYEKRINYYKNYQL
ncbi:lysozyme inhibitor LprI family protein [Rouxiella sp. Mn2063]|uniref:lysozyme inhibitor LprI family protein n=1 Tax=Rouxiella sp. Mn2063 TaxID=3395262 RepID=UPI003BEE7222